MVIRDKYRIEEKIGAGGMATVYRARHLAFNEERALKVVKTQLAEDEGFLKRFRTEAVVARRLQHPNAVRVDDLDTTEDGRPFMVMEFVDGRNLRQAIAQEGPFSAERAISITRQVALAIDAAHQLGITHRDIKPDNILLIRLSQGGDLVKVLDFGIAKIRDGAMDVGAGYTSTRTGMIVGTPQYISPEQAMGKRGEQIDGRADIYSLGIVVYEMLTGQLPFDSDTPMGMVLHHIQTVPQPPDRLRPDLNIPGRLSALLMKALEKEPLRRFQTAREMVYALDDFTNLSTSGARPANKPQISKPQPLSEVASGLPRALAHEQESARSRVKPSPSKLALVSVAILVLLTVGGITVFRLLSRDRQPPAPGTEVRPQIDSAPKVPPTAVATRGGNEDEMILLAVKKILVSTSRGKESLIDVSVKDGVVILTGKANKTDATMVGEVAGAIPGVVQVQNQIQSEVAAHPETRTRPTAIPVAAPPASTVKQQAEHVRQLVAEGNQKLETGDYESAISSFRSALSLDPNNVAAQSGLDHASKAQQTEKDILQKREQNRN